MSAFGPSFIDSIDSLKDVQEWELMCRILERLQKVPADQRDRVVRRLSLKGDDLVRARLGALQEKLRKDAA